MPSLSVLEFEKSLSELDENLSKLRQVVQDRANPQNTPDLPTQIADLEQHRSALLEAFYAHLTPWDQVLLARHEKRPYTLDYISAIFTEFQELHGDRLIADDGAMVAGLARLEGWPVAVIGHQKGRDLKQRALRNFGYARPEGYRKAGRIMSLAAKFGLPIITLVDTKGAAADVPADERGISEAIARTMFEMSMLPVPIISIIIGEGGSGGALGIAVADRVLMMEHSIYSVIAPEGCASILWRDPELGAKAADQLNLTAQSALNLGIIDAIISEPLGGAHRDWAGAGERVKEALAAQMDQLLGMPPQALLAARYDKFRHMGQFAEDTGADGYLDSGEAA